MISKSRFALVTAAVVMASLIQASPAQALNAELFADGLDFPAAFTFAPDGRVFYGERASGETRILSDDGSNAPGSLFFTIQNVVTSGERGLLGIALHPDYPTTNYVYAYASREVSPGNFRNQIWRIEDNGGTGENETMIFDSLSGGGGNHNGGRMLFGPNNLLFVITGEGLNPRNSQRRGNPLGKVLRMRPDGSVPNSNPYNNRTWAYGIRNSFGFDIDPETGRVWATDNGPQCNDELDPIFKGRNYGWGPHQTCEHPPKTPRNTNQDGPNPVLPSRWFNPTTAPTGLAFCDGCGLGPDAEGRFFWGEFNTSRIRKARLNAKRNDIAAISAVYKHDEPVLSLETHPDGRIFFSDFDGIYELTP
ncbi:MAG: PQQ-dependent sugar dehydrogenase [Actinomycetota bacterium]